MGRFFGKGRVPEVPSSLFQRAEVRMKPGRNLCIGWIFEEQFSF
jgi:hypothetical protein